jgi:spore germination protein GerM
VYLHSGNNETCDEVVAVGRTVEGPPTLLAAMRALAQGPTADETSRGLGGWFTQATAAVVKTAEIRGGVATVDFEDLRQRIPNASSSCGSAMLLAQLDRTARQFPSVTATRYSIDGSPDDFYEWLQLAVPGS